MKAKPSVFLFALFLASLASSPLLAQENDLEVYQGRLPKNTLFYVSWKHWRNFEELRATNPFLRLLDSPEMKANWEALKKYQEKVEEIRKKRRQPEQAEPEGKAEGAEKEPQAVLPPDVELQEFAPLFTNPGLLAVVALLPPPDNLSKNESPVALLILYDTTGKDELLNDLDKRLRKPGVTTRNYDFEETIVTETIGPDGKPIGFETRIGPWFVGGDKKEITEAWIRAVQAAPRRSLKGSPVYQRSRSQQDQKAQLELFLNVGLVSQLLEHLPLPAPRAGSTQGPSPEQVLNALGLNAWEAFHLSLGLDRERLRYHFAATYGPAHADVGRIVAPSVADFASVDFAPENALSYSVVELDLRAMWSYLHGIIMAVVPPNQKLLVDGFQAMVETILGGTLEELTTAWGPEFAQISYPAVGGKDVHSLYAVRLCDRARVLTALRNVVRLVGDRVDIEELQETTAGFDITFFKLTLPRAPTEQETENIQLLWAALTGDWLIVSDSQKEIYRALQRTAEGPSLRDNPTYEQLRSRFGPELSSFSFLDVEHWLESGRAEEFLQDVAKGMAQAAQQAEREEPGSETSPADLKPAAPGLPEEKPASPHAPEKEQTFPEPLELKIPRGYLKWMFSATTREAHGLFHTGYIE